MVNVVSINKGRFVHLTVGHTKFAPDNLFASIAKTFYNSDVFCIKMLDHIIQQYATSLILHTQADEALEKKSLEQKYSTIPGITEMLDILVKLGKVYQRRVCFNGEYTPLRNYKYNTKLKAVCFPWVWQIWTCEPSKEASSLWEELPPGSQETSCTTL